MSRPPEPEKRRELASRAVAVLAIEGLEVSMQRLAEALEIKRPTLLYHFPTKGHIVEVALEELLTEQAAFVLERIEAHTHPIDRLDAHLRAVHAFHNGREARIVFLTQALAATGISRMAEIIEVGNRVFAPHRVDAGERVKKGIADGLVHPCDVDSLMATMRALTDGLVVQRLMTGVELGPVHEFLWNHLLSPLKKESPR